MATSKGLLPWTAPSRSPPISEPRELRDRKLSTTSVSRRSTRFKAMRTTTGLPGTSQRNDGYAEARDGSAKKAGPAIVPPAAPEISRNRVFHRDCKGTDAGFTSNFSYRAGIFSYSSGDFVPEEVYMNVLLYICV